MSVLLQLQRKQSPIEFTSVFLLKFKLLIHSNQVSIVSNNQKTRILYNFDLFIDKNTNLFIIFTRCENI